MVYDAVFHGPFGIHIEIAIGVAIDHIGILARVLDQYVIDFLAQAQDLLRLDLDIGCLTLRAA